MSCVDHCHVQSMRMSLLHTALAGSLHVSFAFTHQYHLTWPRHPTSLHSHSDMDFYLVDLHFHLPFTLFPVPFEPRPVMAAAMSQKRTQYVTQLEKSPALLTLDPDATTPKSRLRSESVARRRSSNSTQPSCPTIPSSSKRLYPTAGSNCPSKTLSSTSRTSKSRPSTTTPTGAIMATSI